MTRHSCLHIPNRCRGLEMTMALRAVDDMVVSGKQAVLGITGAPLSGRDDFCRDLVSKLAAEYGTAFKEIDAETCTVQDLSGHDGSFFIDRAGSKPDLVDEAVKRARAGGGIVLYSALTPISGEHVEIGWYDDVDSYEVLSSSCHHVPVLGITQDDLAGLECYPELHDPGLIAILSRGLNDMMFDDRGSFLRAVERWRDIIDDMYESCGLPRYMDNLDKHVDKTLGQLSQGHALDILDALAFGDGVKPLTKPVADLICGVKDSLHILRGLEDANLIELTPTRDSDIGYVCSLTPLMRALRIRRLHEDPGRWMHMLALLYRTFVLTDLGQDSSWKKKNYRRNNHLILQLLPEFIDARRTAGTMFDEKMTDGMAYVNPDPEEVKSLMNSGLNHRAGGFEYSYITSDGEDAIATVDLRDLPTFGAFIESTSSNGGSPAFVREKALNDPILLYSAFVFKNDILDGAGSYASEISYAICRYLTSRYNLAPGGSEHISVMRFSVRLLSQALDMAVRGNLDIGPHVRRLNDAVNILKTSIPSTPEQEFLNGQVCINAGISLMAAKSSRPDMRWEIEVDADYKILISQFADFLDRDLRLQLKDRSEVFTPYSVHKFIKPDGTMMGTECIINLSYMLDLSVYGLSKRFSAPLNHAYGRHLVETDIRLAGRYLEESMASYDSRTSQLGYLNAMSAYCRCRTLQHILGIWVWEEDPNNPKNVSENGSENDIKNIEGMCNRALADSVALGLGLVVRDLRLILARIMILTGRFSVAAANIESAKALLPESPSIYEALGDLRVFSGDPLGAMNLYQVALDGFGDVIHPWEAMVIKSKIYNILITWNMEVPPELASELGTYCASSMAKKMDTSFKRIQGNMMHDTVDRFFL